MAQSNTHVQGQVCTGAARSQRVPAPPVLVCPTQLPGRRVSATPRGRGESLSGHQKVQMWGSQGKRGPRACFPVGVETEIVLAGKGSSPGGPCHSLLIRLLASNPTHQESAEQRTESRSLPSQSSSKAPITSRRKSQAVGHHLPAHGIYGPSHCSI